MKRFFMTVLALCLICATVAGCADGGSTQSERYLTAEPIPSLDAGADADSVDVAADPADPAGVSADLANIAADSAGVSADSDSDTAALPPNDEITANQESSAQTSGPDLDLTALSSTMVYAEVYNMIASPDDYVGRTVKMSGPYYAQYYEETEQYYHYVIIEDATACCQQGLEFVWSGEHSYPDDYPATDARIEVAGVFDSYDELGVTYYRLVADDVTIL